jgi:6-phosphogluconolactonase/glucosamine-6-phosphate isomerase/deaminase
MHFKQSDTWQSGADELRSRLTEHLGAGRSVLWALSGGTNIAISAAVLEGIPEALTHRLTICLVDERYGEPGHPDSNWQQLIASGIDFKQATVFDVLTPRADHATTIKRYDDRTREALAGHDVVVVQLGIGDDGHTAGILPGSPAAHDVDAWVTGFENEPYTRITWTFRALLAADEAYVFAFGENKHEALQQLATLDLPLFDQPAQIFKQLPNITVYNDRIGGGIQ